MLHLHQQMDIILFLLFKKPIKMLQVMALRVKLLKKQNIKVKLNDIKNACLIYLKYATFSNQRCITLDHIP